MAKPIPTKSKPPAQKPSGDKMPVYKDMAVNRRAFHDYEILEHHEAGIALTGSEIKSVRAGKVSLQEAYARPERGEIWLQGAHIAKLFSPADQP